MSQIATDPCLETNAPPNGTTILIADSFSSTGADTLRSLGCDVHIDPTVSG